MRTVDAKYWDRDQKVYIAVTGKFHQWGCKYQEFESGPGNYTVALVEDQNGQIRECEPSSVTFND